MLLRETEPILCMTVKGFAAKGPSGPRDISASAAKIRGKTATGATTP